MSDIPPGGREKDNRKQKLAEKEKIVDRAICRDLPRTAVLCRGNFFIFKILGRAFPVRNVSGRDSRFVAQNRLIRRFSISVHLNQCKRELGTVWNRPPRSRIRVHSAPSLSKRTAMISYLREEYNPDSVLAS